MLEELLRGQKEALGSGLAIAHFIKRERVSSVKKLALLTKDRKARSVKLKAEG